MNTNKNRTVLEAGDFTVQIDHHARWGKTTKARIYVSGQDDVDFTEAWALLHEKDPQNIGASEEVNALFRKLNRQEVKNMKAVITEALMTVEGLEEVLLDDNKLTFSKTAGCGCGCSPAFVPKTGITHDGLLVESIFITKKKEA